MEGKGRKGRKEDSGGDKKGEYRGERVKGEIRGEQLVGSKKLGGCTNEVNRVR